MKIGAKGICSMLMCLPNPQESTYLDELVDQARDDEERLRSQVVSDWDRLIIVVARKPLIAMRYQLPTTQVAFLPCIYSAY